MIHKGKDTTAHIKKLKTAEMKFPVLPQHRTQQEKRIFKKIYRGAECGA